MKFQGRLLHTRVGSTPCREASLYLPRGNPLGGRRGKNLKWVKEALLGTARENPPDRVRGGGERVNATAAERGVKRKNGMRKSFL